jgi:hypothetical protein
MDNKSDQTALKFWDATPFIIVPVIIKNPMKHIIPMGKCVHTKDSSIYSRRV